jgi:ribonuclease-3
MSLIGKNMNLIDYVIINKSVDLSSSKTVDKINSDLYESIVGAIYLDSDYETVKNFIYQTLINFKSFVDYNYKGQLNQLCHQKKIKEPKYNLIHDSGPDHNKEYKVSVCVNNKKFFGSGKKIKEAEIEAAKDALINLFCF